MRILKVIAVQAGLLLATIAAIDLVAYFALPESVVEHLPDYRGKRETTLLGRGYPKDYYMAHAERGFDIKPTPRPRTDQWHAVDDVSYRVWSNDLGCFDRPHRAPMPPYIYFAGDSVTWGYAPSDTKFGLVFEQLSGIDVLKCGVSHTGQRHQFAKFLEIGTRLGRWPDKAVVFYSPTDVVNDYAHPHSTVLNGHLADVVCLDEAYDQLRLDAALIDRAFIQNQTGIGQWLARYSLTSHAVRKLVEVAGISPAPHWADRYVMHQGRKVYDLHRLTYLQTRGGLYRYASFKYAEANKQIITEWGEHARRFGYKLEFVLLPSGDELASKEKAASLDFYGELKSFLDGLGIKHHDLAREFDKRKVDTKKLYWDASSHFSEDGNIIVGEILAEIL